MDPKTKRTAYRIGKSDIVTLASPSAPQDISIEGLLDAKARKQIYPVRGDGTISVPGLDPIPIGGLTLAAAEEAVFDALITKNLEPNFSFEVTEYRSQSATITGAVATPLVAPLSNKPLYLDQALQLAGGVTAPNPDNTIVRIYRDGARYQLSASDAVSARFGRTALQDADRIVVESVNRVSNPERIQSHLEGVKEFEIRAQQLSAARQNFDTQLQLGAVKQDAVYILTSDGLPKKLVLPFEDRANLADALSSSEAEEGLRHLYILRSVNSTQTALHFDLRDPAILILTPKMELRPNDVVYLTDQRLRNLNRLQGLLKPLKRLGKGQQNG